MNIQSYLTTEYKRFRSYGRKIHLSILRLITERDMQIDKKYASTQEE